MKVIRNIKAGTIELHQVLESDIVVMISMVSGELHLYQMLSHVSGGDDVWGFNRFPSTGVGVSWTGKFYESLDGLLDRGYEIHAFRTLKEFGEWLVSRNPPEDQ